MKSAVCCCLGLLLVITFPSGLPAANYISEADKLFDQGGLDNFKQAIELYQKALAENPASYEANWKCARAYREYGDAAKTQKLEGWKEICAKYGKEGMNYAQKAIELDPKKPDGYYYYGLNVGIYSDGVSIFTALSEGLKDKTQKSFEKTYDINKMYKEGGPMIALGRFWQVLPWPMYDRKKSLQFYREYQATQYFADNIEVHVYLGELLIQMGGKKNKAEAKGYLEKAAKSDDAFYKERANELLKKL
ncbi:MAG: tetratricopeptide repeat protein [Desulfobacterales bacterium]|nr:MAG: tetratricopeptide repeat protein [Desulfobacterales bacterium]